MGGRRKAPSGKGGKAKLWTGGPQPTTSLPCKSREGQPRRPWTPSLQRPPFTPPQPASVTVSILQTGLLRLQSWVPGLLPALGLWPVSASGCSWPFLHGARCLTHAGGQSSRALCSPSRPWRCHTPRPTGRPTDAALCPLLLLPYSPPRAVATMPALVRESSCSRPSPAPPAAASRCTGVRRTLGDHHECLAHCQVPGEAHPGLSFLISNQTKRSLKPMLGPPGSELLPQQVTGR